MPAVPASYARAVFYAFARAVVGFALRLFYRLKVRNLPPDLDGPVIFVGNHPNSIIDPALLFATLPRRIAFLARAPLFEVPVFGWILRGLGALPVYRRQDDPGRTERNEGTFEAASGALLRGGAITVFPEGKSHSEPRLQEIKTGAARIALRSLRRGARVRVVAVGLTYAEKHRFRSEVLIDGGEPIDAAVFGTQKGEADAEAVRALTERIEAALAKVTLNLEQWEDLPLIQTGEELYALRLGDRAHDPDRLRRFGRGVELFRREQPERFEHLRGEVITYRRRLELLSARPKDVALAYNRALVWKFSVRNAAAILLGLPLFALGVAVFAVPFYLPRWLTRALHPSLDRQGTVKFISTLVLAPIVLASLGLLAWRWGGAAGTSAALAGAIPLAVFTRYFYERRRIAMRDIRVFLALHSRRLLRAMLLAEGERLAQEIEAAALEYKPRVMEPAVGRQP